MVPQLETSSDVLGDVTQQTEPCSTPERHDENGWLLDSPFQNKNMSSVSTDLRKLLVYQIIRIKVSIFHHYVQK